MPLPIGCFLATLALDIASRTADDDTGYARASTVVLGLGVAGALLAIDLVALCLLTVTGWLGGKLAYRYGVRVADERTQAEGYEDVSGLLPPALSSAGRVDRIPGTNIPEDQAR